MKSAIHGIMKRALFLMLAFGLFALQTAWAAEGNISDRVKYVWSENGGWVNLRPAQGGVSVYGTYLTGYAWAENIGWVKLGNDDGGPYANSSAADWGVNNDERGNLSGYAWSENAGWIRFNTHDTRVAIGSEGRFEGYAWSENLGWIHFSHTNPAYGVETSFSPGEEGFPDSDDSG